MKVMGHSLLWDAIKSRLSVTSSAVHLHFENTTVRASTSSAAISISCPSALAGLSCRWRPDAFPPEAGVLHGERSHASSPQHLAAPSSHTAGDVGIPSPRYPCTSTSEPEP